MRGIKIAILGAMLLTSFISAGQFIGAPAARAAATTSLPASIEAAHVDTKATPRPPRRTATPVPASPTAPPAVSVTAAPATATAVPPTATAVPPSATPVPPSATPVPPTVMAPATAITTPPAGRLYGLAGQGATWEPLDSSLLTSQYNAGVRGRLIEANWKDLQPTGPTSWAAGAAQALQARIDAILASGPDIVLYLDLGLQYPPAWAAATDPLRDQFGATWQASNLNGGGVNVYWSPTVRDYVAGYLRNLFTHITFHDKLWIVRAGPYTGELIYPDKANAGGDSFWAFDATAQASSPVPGWRPGQPSPNGEGGRFYNWYVDNLAGTFNFLLTEIRRYFAGYVAPVTAGAGLYDGSVAQLVSRNLVDPQQSHTGTGNYWQRIFAALPGADQNVVNWCSSVGDLFPSQDDSSPNWYQWSSAKQQAYLAQRAGRRIYGENPGRNAFDSSGGADGRTTMQWDFAAIRNYGYMGLMWVRESDMNTPGNASLAQYGSLIGATP
jgi:hypothetical protein